MCISIRLSLVCAAAACLAACAGSMEKTASLPAARAVPATAGNHRRDDAYVAAVERIARRRGIDVHWVNPPDGRGRVADR